MKRKAPLEYQAQVEEVIDQASGKVYLSPCQIACPLGEDIQRNHAMLALIPSDLEKASRQIIKIGDEIYEKNPLFPLCSYICGLCEKKCNYKDQTGAVRRRLLVRLIAEHYLSYLETKPPFPSPTKEKVAVIGGGPGGLMCAYILSKKGYRVTIIERNPNLGGALRYIPKYRLPQEIIHSVIDNLVRIAHIEVKLNAKIGDDGKTLDDLKQEGYRAIFIATGTPSPRPLTIEGKPVATAELAGVMFGLNLLYEVNQGNVPLKLYNGKKVIVVGGGNVAFDVARTARRLGGEVTLVCLECADKSSKDGIPADTEEIEGATEEGIEIIYSRGVEEIIGKGGKFSKIKCPRCTSVFDTDGRFNPKCDRSDVIYLEGDMLLVTIGQGPEMAFYRQESLLNERGRLDIDPVSLMSNTKEGVFIGGDVRRVGFAAEAMRDGVTAAEAIDRYLKGEQIKTGSETKEYKSAPVPRGAHYKSQPEAIWAPVADRMNFEPFEKGFTLEEAVKEARRCLCCGPCRSCKACVALELQPEIPKIEYNKDLCIACGNCVFYCPYDAAKLESPGGISFDPTTCKGCGLCVVLCPAMALELENWEKELISTLITKASSEMKSPKILVFRCQWTYLATLSGEPAPNIRFIDLPCAARVDTAHILEALQKGIDGILIAACPEEDCHRVRGSQEAQHSIAKLKERLGQIGLKERLHFCTVSPHHPEELDRELAKFSQQIKGLGKGG
jgi:NADPH-dependent glutamate synthase beta subunit-like oxidoreductase/coenzyme F420-reducing hydrogenase delta subunit/Pyruvate/2-oxoacid:ferredoxin oxidoreductase delta subunit